MVINENLTDVYKGVYRQVGELCRRHIGATGSQVWGRGSSTVPASGDPS